MTHHHNADVTLVVHAMNDDPGAEGRAVDILNKLTEAGWTAPKRTRKVPWWKVTGERLTDGDRRLVNHVRVLPGVAGRKVRLRFFDGDNLIISVRTLEPDELTTFEVEVE